MIKKSEFEPHKWVRSSHLQTLWPSWVRKNKKNSYISERLTTDDDDFLDLAWSALPVGNYSGPILIIFHGLEGSIESPYVKGLFAKARENGWIAVLMHFRGCSGEPNKTLRRYHSGETSDADFVIRRLRDRFPLASLIAIGFSLGGNMLLKYLGEQKEQCLLRAAVAISVPFELSDCLAELESGFSRVYQQHLLGCLKDASLKKMETIDHSSVLKFPAANIKALKTIRDFDEFVTAPIHGFKNADDYYQQSSSRQFLQDIQCKTLILQARDDPFVSKSSIPTNEELSEHVTLELSENGGHVGFVNGSICAPEFWLDERVALFVENCLKHRFN